MTVSDAVTGDPVPFVTVYNQDRSKSKVCDSEGKVSLTDFKSTDQIIFRSMGYEVFTSSLSEIQASGYSISLQPSSRQMKTIVVSASKFKQRKKDIPQKIIAYDREEVIKNNPQTSADLLAQTGQVFVQKSQQGGGSPLIRGFSTNRLLITVDGVRMNNAIFRGGNLQNVISIDPLAIDRTEVILGPGSVVYGSDAIGGVMNFYTQQASYAQDSLTLNGNALVRYATANQEKTVHAGINLVTRRFTSTTSITANFYEDLRMGSDGPDEYLRPVFTDRTANQDFIARNENPLKQVPSGFDQISLLQKFGYRASDRWDLTLGTIYSATSEFDRYDALARFRESVNPNGQPYLEPRQAEWYYDPQIWFMTYLKATHKSDGNWYDRAIFTHAFQLFQEGRNIRDFQQPQLFQNDEQVEAISSAVDFERYDNKGNTLFYGAEFIHNRVGSQGSMFNIETGATVPATSRYPDDAVWESLAVYANYQWKLRSDLTLQSGLRYNFIWIDAVFDDILFNLPFDEAHLDTGALTGALGGTYRPGDRWEFRLNLSTAFRAPNIDDIGKIFEPSPGSVIVPNRDLKSEYAYTAEIGAIYRPKTGVQFQVAGYYTFLDNVLVARDYQLAGRSFLSYQGTTSQVQAIQNEESARVYGLELGAEVKLSDDFRLVGHYTTIDGEQMEEDGDRVAVRHVAPDFGDLHIIYEHGDLFLDAFWVFNGQLDFEDLAPSQQSRPWLYAQNEAGDPFSPRWYTLNLRTGYQVSTAVRAVATLENITDQRYRTYSSGIAAPGRNLILALNYLF